ncbi:hypothetical protein [Microbacterium sp. KR10-403]|uniref:hypothetical protein n=1 Tax=Microbacterium sp. KR10-403 TaxID=3158581 RepID=UPI0032E388D1
MKFHKTGDGFWQRCQATVRVGQGVTDCPIELEGVPLRHTIGFHGVAEAGGGVIRRAVEDGYRETKIIPNGDDTFTADTGKLKRVYGMDGKLLKLKDRKELEKRIARDNDLPQLDRRELLRVDEELARLDAEVASALKNWDKKSGAEFRSKLLAFGEGVKHHIHTEEGIALMLVVSGHQYPKELVPVMAGFREQITEDADPRSFLIQRAREKKAAEKGGY